MSLAGRLAAVQRLVLLAVVVLTAVVFWQPALDDFSLPKATVAVAGAALVVVAAVARTVVTGKVSVPATPLLWAVIAFVVAVALATATSPDVATSLVGAYGRVTGAVPYVAYVVLLLAVLRRFDRERLIHVASAVAVAAGLVALYGLLQAAGADPFPWRADYGTDVFSTLGNPNFAAGYLAVGLPVTVWGALDSRWGTPVRAAFAVATVAVIVAMLATGSSQGPVAGGAGVAALSVSWLRRRGDRIGQVGSWLVGAAALAVALVLAAGLAGFGPLAAFGEEESFRQRADFWSSAAAMVSDDPVLGVGMDLYGGYYRAYRPLRAAVTLDVVYDADAPHSVPLDMFASGGTLLGVAYLSVIGVTAWALVTGLRRLDGERLLLLGGLGGAWVAYQVQSLVSIDVPPLAVAHWVLAGAVVVAGTAPGSRVLRLPWAPAEPRPAKKGRHRPPRTRRRVGLEATVIIIASAVALVGLVMISRPLRADIAAERGKRLTATGDGSAALAAFEEAHRLAPWESTYWQERGNLLAGGQRMEDAMAAYEAAVARDPRGFVHVRSAARAAVAVGEVDRAVRWYERLLEIEPQAPAVKVEAGRFLASNGRPREGVALIERALALEPSNADWWVLLGKARFAAGDVAEARTAFEEALEVEPGHDEGTAALAALAADAGS